MTKKKVITQETFDDSDIPTDPEDNEPTPDEIELAEFMGSLGGGVTVKIFKMQEGQQAYCGQAEPAILNEDYLYRHWGGGRYYLRAIMNNRFVRGANKIITIYEPEIRPGELPGAPQATGSNGDLTNLLLSQIKQQHETMLELIKAQSGGQKSSMEDLLQLAQLLKDNNSKGDPLTMLPSMVELFKTVMESSKDLAGGEDPKMAWVNFGMRVLDKLPGTVGQIMASRAISKTASPEEQREQAQQRAQEMLAKGIGMLKEKAERNLDLEYARYQADQILDNLNNPIYKAIAYQLMNMPFEKFGEIDPEIVKPPLRAWFIEVYNTLHQGLQDAEQNEPAAGQGGGAADIEADEGPGDTGDSEPGPAPDSA